MDLQGRRIVGDEKEVEKERVAKRFYTALVLHSLIQEVPITNILHAQQSLAKECHGTLRHQIPELCSQLASWQNARSFVDWMSMTAVCIDGNSKLLGMFMEGQINRKWPQELI